MWRHGNTAVSRGSLRQITQSSGVTKGVMYGPYGGTLSGNIWYYMISYESYDIFFQTCFLAGPFNGSFSKFNQIDMF